MGSGMKKAAVGMVASFGAFSAVDFLKDSVNAASDLSESMSKSAVVFGKSNAAVTKFALGAAKSMGISRQAATEATATFGNFLGALGLTQSKSASMSMTMVKLAGDMASFNNIDATEVLLALRSGLAGEAEPLKAFGVDVSDAALQVEALRVKMKKTGDTFTASQKAQLAYGIIMRQTKTAQGDFARTSGGLANQQRILAARIQDAKAKIGKFFLPAVIAVFKVMTENLTPALIEVIWGIKQLGKWVRSTSIYTHLVPALTTAVKFLASNFVPALKKTVEGVKAFSEWMKTGSIGVYMIKGAIVALAVAVTVFGAIALAIKAVTIATAAWSFVLSANPIFLIIVAIGALVGAVIYAYKNFTTFRNIVNEAWRVIKLAAVVAWEKIKQAAQIGWAILKVIFKILVIEINILIKYFKIFWAVVRVAWIIISTVIKIAWAIIGPIFRLITKILTVTLKNAFTFIANIVKITWIAIQIYIKLAWLLIRGYFNALKFFIMRVLAPVIRWLYTNVVRPVFSSVSSFIRSHMNTVKTVISNVWRNGIRPVFNLLKSALGVVKSAFSSTVSGIRSIWNRLIGIAKTPVNFIIGIYNGGLVPMVNGIARLAGINTRLDKLNKFAGGGVMPGYAPGRDSLLAAVSPGESIFRPEFTKAVGSRWVGQANAMAKRRGSAGVQKWMTGGNRMGGEGIGFANGGIVGGFAGRFADGGVAGFLKGLGGWLFNAPEKIAKTLLNKLMGGGVPGSGMFRDLIAGIPRWIKDNIWGWIKKHLGGAGGPGMKKGLDFARAQAGKPYVWGGVGPGGYDCSGFQSAIVNVIKGRNPYSRLFTTHGFTGAVGPAGFMRGAKSGFQMGITHAGVGHMAGTLMGVNVESSGSRGVRTGPGARGAADGLFTTRYGLSADSGRLSLQRGWNPPVYNGTGRVEHLATSGAGGAPVIANYGVIGSQVELDRWLTKSWERLTRHDKIPPATRRR
jgi:hypothetical protein